MEKRLDELVQQWITERQPILKCHCGEPEIFARETPAMKHFAEVRCLHCNKHLGYLPKPESQKKKRPKVHADLVNKHSNGYCEMCLRRREELPSKQVLEAHHVQEFHDGGEAERGNVWIVCTGCHRLIDWVRDYHGKHELVTP